MKYIFLTNTKWSEPPRLRHQLALLLEKNGNEIYFFERPTVRNTFTKIRISKKMDIGLVGNVRLFHHRLSIGILNKIDCLIMNNRLQNFVDENKIDTKDTVIVNFIYDYSVRLKKTFKVYTFINDDFESQTAFWNFNYKRKSTVKNIESSGRLITVSPLLTNKYKKISCKKWELLPWVTDYENECIGHRLDNSHINSTGIIFYGFVNNRLDFDLIEQAVRCLPNFNFDFYGEISDKVINKVNYLRSQYKNIHFAGSVGFCDIDFSRYFCSITPYCGHASDKVVYATNKLFRLAAAGLPSINIGLPGLIEDASTIKVNTSNKFIDAVLHVSKNIIFYQNNAKKLASNHTELTALNNWNIILSD